MDSRTRAALVIAVVAGVAVAGIGAYELLQPSPSPVCGAGETGTICLEQAEVPDSLDPAVSFSTAGWGAVQQVYQGLVGENGSSGTNFSGVLASHWSVSDGGRTYTFDLRSGVTFSNGDPYNAYVQWYSLYRALLMAQAPAFVLEQNFFPTNLSGGPINYTSPLPEVEAANATLARDLNSWDFATPNATEVALMGLPNQSFQVLNASAIALHVGYGYLGDVPYAYLLATLVDPVADAVDPIVVDANGGVVVGAPNAYLADHAIGTGPYELGQYAVKEGGGYVLTPSPNYWAPASAAAGDPAIAPANATVRVTFQVQLSTLTDDLLSGRAAAISLAGVDPSTVAGLESRSGVTVQALPAAYDAASGAWWVYLNASAAPFDNLSVREAVVHAVNVSAIISGAFDGAAQPWVGPVPAGYPGYDPGGLPPYAFNLALAQSEIADSPCAADACQSHAIAYAYLDEVPGSATAASDIVQDLSAIGLTLRPVPLNFSQYYEEASVSNGTCGSATSENGGPFPIGQADFASDYFAPDDWTQADAAEYGSANRCLAGYDNATANRLVYAAASALDASTQARDYANLTALLYDNYTDLWLLEPTTFAAYSTDLHGFVTNPMGAAEPATVLVNTEWLGP